MFSVLGVFEAFEFVGVFEVFDVFEGFEVLKCFVCLSTLSCLVFSDIARHSMICIMLLLHLGEDTSPNTTRKRATFYVLLHNMISYIVLYNHS